MQDEKRNSSVGTKQTKANSLAKDFSRNLEFLDKNREKIAKKTTGSETLHVVTAGAAVSEIYEKVRNASENAEENLLLMHAIRRFLKRIFLIGIYKNAAENLITDLTLSGYLKNDSISLETVREIDATISDFAKLRVRLLVKFSREVADHWTTEPMSAKIEQMLHASDDSAAIIELAKDYFAKAIDTEKLLHITSPKNYDILLFVAASASLAKQDEATIRMNLLERYKINLDKAVSFAKFNRQLDGIFQSENLAKISHVISRNGAAFRILAKTAAADKNLSKHVFEEKSLIGPFDTAIGETYASVHRNINRGVARSVIFLVITKFLIGIALEVPYDLWFHHAVIWEALVINLLLPPLYMVALRFTLAMPGLRNRLALQREISRIFYSPVPSKPFLGSMDSRKFGAAYNFFYLIFIGAIFVGIGWLLMTFAKFEWPHLAIFFFFISTASFLGFRLSRQIREIEVGRESMTGASLLRDLVYMPFVAVGRRISETYSRFNLISQILDIFVELPLKTILDFIRQWGNFLSAKRDEF